MGKVVIATDVRLFQDADGQWFSSHGSVSTDAIEIYSRRYERTVLIARVTTEDPGRANALLTEGLEVVALRDNPSQEGLVGSARAIVATLRRMVLAPDDLVVVRVPEFVSALTWFALRKRDVRLVASVVFEPAEVASIFTSGMLGGVLGRGVTWVSSRILKRSDGVHYVTRRSLQAALPAPAGTPTVARSDVRVSADQRAREPRTYDAERTNLKVVAMGHLDATLKGFDVLVDAVAQVRGRGYDVSCTILGDGLDRELILSRAEELGIAPYVELAGFVASRSEVFAALDDADMFAMPSRAEGLPRALIEAMARGMASVGSRVGGIPELLSDEALIDSGSSDQLATLFERAFVDPGYLSRLASEALKVADEVIDAAAPEIFEEFLDDVAEYRASR